MQTVSATDLKSFYEWLNGKSELPAVYHRGHLSCDLERVDYPRGKGQPAQSVMNLAMLRKAVQMAEKAGEVCLAQKRITITAKGRDTNCFAYIAIKTQAQRNRATIDERLAA